jgi:ACS family hexuronate transporter-like MFS transporter
MQKRSGIRWAILSLLFFATTINYIDRQVIGLLKPYIEKDLHWDEADYGYIVTAFQFAYAGGLLVSGGLLDKYGLRIGYTMAVVVWSIGAILHAFINSVVGFGFARIVLGIGEAGNFPASVKTVAEWFPQRERALATGIFNSGSTIGAITAPIIVSLITLSLGWRWAFVITGSLGFIWLIFWWFLYYSPQKHPKVNPEELDYILANANVDTNPGTPIKWKDLFKYRATYAVCISRFLTEWVWWFFLFWTPDFLSKKQHINLKASILPLAIIYTLASLGGLFGGALSSYLIKIGRSVDFSRKTAILVCAFLALPLIMAANITYLPLVIVIIGMATAAHQGWASNIFTIISDVFPKHIVASVVGLSGFSGAIGGALAATFVGLILKFTGSYTIIFVLASTTYFLAWLTLKILIPRITQIKPVSNE